MQRLGIHTDYHSDIESYVVSLPGGVSYSALKNWGIEFIRELQTRSGTAALLFNTNAHNFESIDCLKWLREFFAKEDVFTSTIRRVAFVQPIQYRSPEVVSDTEAYFSTV